MMVTSGKSSCALFWALVMLTACDSVQPARLPSDKEQRETVRSLPPATQSVDRAHADLLWKAARGYMERVFPLAVNDPGRRILETETLEWTEDRLPHRTRVTVQVADEPNDAQKSRVGIVALLIEPQLEFNHIVSGQPLAYSFRVVGKNTKIEEQVLGDVMQRFLALREGRDPDAGAPPPRFKDLEIKEEAPLHFRTRR